MPSPVTNSVKRLELARVGRLVDAAQEMELGLGQRLGHGLVGREHELFDDLMALRVHHHVGAGHAALASRSTFTSCMRQFQRTAAMRRCAQDHGQFVHVGPASECTSGVELGRQASRIGQILVDLFIGEPPAALDRAEMQARRCSGIPSGVNSMNTRLGVPHPIGLQAGQAVGDHLRQHGDHAVGQVDAGGRARRLRDRAPCCGRTKCDTSAMCTPSRQCPLSSLFQRNRVVEVAGVDRVDRDRSSRGSGRVRPRRCCSSKRVGLAAGLVQGVFGEVVGQVEFADDRQRVDARLATRPEHFGDHPFAFCGGEGKRTISTTTLSSGWAFLAPGSPTQDGLREQSCRRSARRRCRSISK